MIDKFFDAIGRSFEWKNISEDTLAVSKVLYAQYKDICAVIEAYRIALGIKGSIKTHVAPGSIYFYLARSEELENLTCIKEILTKLVDAYYVNIVPATNYSSEATLTAIDILKIPHYLDAGWEI